MRFEPGRGARTTILVVVAVVLLRLLVAAVTPLTFDEAYYWTWSKHLAGGYFDHPPMVAFVIRLGTLLAGDSEFGIRLIAVLLALPMSWAVYRAGVILFADERVAATATIALNATMMVMVGALIVTPDAPLMAASAVLLFFLAKISQTGQGAWWLAAGAAGGLALLSKYTALFFGPAILLWLAVVPQLRHWLRSPWLYAGAAVAVALFSPVIVWNAQHQWASFVKQFGRAQAGEFTLRYVGELIPAQVGLAMPLVFVLGAMGMFALVARRSEDRAAPLLLHAMVWPVLAYFAWHSLHSRVEANWLAPLYPPFALAAGVAAHGTSWHRVGQRLVDFCRCWALPSGVVVLVFLSVQVNTGVLTGFRRDPSVKKVGVGWRELASKIESVRAREAAGCVLAADYGTTAWLAFYLPDGNCVMQTHERIRWVNAPAPPAAALAGRLLMIRTIEAGDVARVSSNAETVAVLERKRGPTVVERFRLDIVAASAIEGSLVHFPAK